MLVDLQRGPAAASDADVCGADEGQQLPDIPERELSLDVLSMDQLGAQRLESLGALGSFGQQNLGSSGKLGGLHLAFLYCCLKSNTAALRHGPQLMKTWRQAARILIQHAFRT